MKTEVLIADGWVAPKPPAFAAQGFLVPNLPCEGQAQRDSAVVSFKDPRLTVAPHENADQAAVFADLVERIAGQADRAAFTQLFAHYAPRVKGYLLRLGLSSPEAEEVSQEVMVAVWRKAASFDRHQASVATWIFRIARNRRIDVFRREQRTALDAHDPAFQPDGEAPPDQAAETAEREAQLRQAIAALPPEQRDLVRVAFYEDLSHSQVAERTGLPLGTVKSRLRLAFAKLRLRIETEDEAASQVGRS